jgi:hypothetical protein
VCTRFTQAWLPDFSTDPPFDCADDDSSDAAFVRATSLIDGRGTVEQYLACRMFPLLASFGFGEIVEGETSVSKITLPLPEFPLTKVEGECDAHFLARVELSAENVVGSYGRTEHDACVLALLNGGRLNWVFEKAGVAYGLYPEPSTEASKEAVRKRKIDAVVGPVGKALLHQRLHLCPQKLHRRLALYQRLLPQKPLQRNLFPIRLLALPVVLL